MKKVGLLGGTHFIGYHLTWALHGHGYEVTLYNRGKTIPPGDLPRNIKHIRGNRERPLDFQKLFHTDYDFVIDLSGYTPAHVEPIINNHRDSIGHYLFCSTSSTYKTPPPYFFNEGSERTFIPNTYGGNKALAEDLILGQFLKNKWPVTIFRPHGVWGPYQAPQAKYVFSRMVHSMPIPTSPYSDVRINLLYVEDLVNAFLTAMNSPVSHGSVYGVAGDEITSQIQFIDFCGRACSLKPALKYITHPRYSETIMKMSWGEFDLVADNRKIKKQLGMSFTTMEDAMHKTFEWMRSNPNSFSYKPFRGEHYLLMDKPIPKSAEVFWKLMNWVKGTVLSPYLMIPNKIKLYFKSFDMARWIKEKLVD